MVIHRPWKGEEFQVGINGQRVAIVGYSHWNGDLGRPDYDNFTLDVVCDIVSGKDSHNFFSQIRNYFGFDDHASFWPRVLFFNYVPHCIGGPDQRFDVVGEEENDVANERFLDLLNSYGPEKVIVFTSKGWGSLPPFHESLPLALDSTDLERVLLRDPCGIYKVNDRRVMAFGLRHPQGASSEPMSNAVARILAIPLK